MQKSMYQRVMVVFLSLILVVSMFSGYIPTAEAQTSDRSITFSYERADGNYEGWNLWVWGTGVQDDQIDYTEVKDGKAIFNIAVAPDVDQIGFVLRKGTDWAEKDVDADRYITLNKNDAITKVHVKSGVLEFTTVPDGSAPVVENGNATFFFRDKDLYAQDAMNTVEKVELEILGQLYAMQAEPKNERFTYTLENLPQGEHSYKYFVTVNGTTTEMTDPYNTVDGQSVVKFLAADFQVTGTADPVAVSYNENSVIAIDLGSDTTTGVREMYMDLTAVGGEEKVAVDPELKELTVAVDQSVTAGVKTLPITVVDEYGNSHQGEASLEVKASTFTGEEADFDWDESVIYFMLTDRFFDGDSTNNDPYGIGYDTSKTGTYQGGDFKGITQKLDYLDELGINTIWISPIVDNINYDVRYKTPDTPYYAYHGYWADNFGQLNPHFGSMADLHELIDEAHNRGIKIMVDVVLNHTGYGLKASDAGTTGVANFPTDEDRARFDGMLRDGGSDTVKGELAGLPDLLTEESAVRDQIVKWQTDWIEKSKTANGNTIDYFRVDTVKHVEDATWMKFKNELTKIKPDHKMIGEYWGANVNDDGGYLNSGMMDSLLDFDFKNYAKNLADGQINTVEAQLESRNAELSNDATLGQFLGSHDEDRFFEAVGGDLGKYQIAASLQMTAKGQPVIYYGEELGLPGKNNYPIYDNRPNMPWDQVEGNKILTHYQKVLAFRNANTDVFAKGERIKIAGSDSEQYLVFERSYNDESAYVGLNTSTAVKEAAVNFGLAEAVVTDHYSGKTYTTSADGKATVTIPAMEDGGTALFTLEGGTAPVEEPKEEAGEIAENTLRIHYQRTDNSYENLGVWLWGDVQAPSENWPSGGTPFDGVTEYGAYVDVKINGDAQNVGFLVLNRTTGEKDGGDKAIELSSPDMNEVWIEQGSDEVFLYEPADLPEDTVRIYYEREDGNYDGWALWNWGDVAAPSDGWPNGATDKAGVGKFGAYYDIKLAENASKVSFLFVHKPSGAQTGDMSFEMLDQYNTVFVKEGEDKVYTNPYGTVKAALLSGEVLSDTEISLRFSKTEGLTEAELAEQIMVTGKDGNAVDFTDATIEGPEKILLNGTFDIEKLPYTISYGERSVEVKSGWKLIDAMYGYDGKLGAELHKNGSATLKVWSPKADSVEVVLYDKKDQNKIVETVEMEKGDRGVWSVTLDKKKTGVQNHRGYFYHYKVTHGEETKLALDPYAQSMAAWSSESGDPVGKAAIVDVSSISPKLDFADIPGYEKREDTIIYEAHVRDFTSDPNIADELEHEFGTFAAFVEKLDYIQDLGVTHIQLLPVMSYYFSNEFEKDQRLLEYDSQDTNYNWGYDPQSYFSLTGMYSEKPEDPEKRIKEFKKLIKEIHKRDMGVVLDVVYNHTAQVSIFEDLVPNYYHFMDADGTPRTSFGGGRLGTTHKMSRRILEDSIMHWVNEYKVDGFRFDMMGDHDAESIQRAFDKAKKVNPNLVMIGEGWRTFAGDEGEPVQAADQDWMQHTEAVGSFSDEFRNELKSGFGSEGQPRFLTGGARNIQQIFDNIKAQPHNFTADQPGDVVQYIAAHDNLTLYDVIAQSIKKDPDIPENNLEIHKRIRIGNAMVLTSQGTAFIHAGQEFGRTKQWRAEAETAPYKSTYMEDENGNPFKYPYFIHDSYDSSDIINRFDWEKATNKELYPINNVTREYTSGLIKLRRSTDAFRLGSKELIDANVTLLDAPEIKDNDLLIAYQAKATNGDVYHVFINADSKARTLTLGEDLTKGRVLIDGDEAGTEEVSEVTGFELTAGNISIDPLTTVVVKVGDEEEKKHPGKGKAKGKHKE